MPILTEIKKLVPPPGRSAVRGALYLVGDSVDLLLRRRDALIPPRRLRCRLYRPYRDPRHYRATAEEFFEYFKTLCNLHPDERILDVGCGSGHMTIPLSGYLCPKGEYYGFDVNRPVIEWCRANISSEYPNFNFQVADIYNAAYNPTGKHSASEYTFPYESEFFDFVFAKSVFTHLPPEDLNRYLGEIARVLRTGGRALLTFLLLNEESKQGILAGKSALDFGPACDDFWAVNRAMPEEGVCYREGFVLDCYEKRGLRVGLPVWYGSWCGRDRFAWYQDMIVAWKP